MLLTQKILLDITDEQKIFLDSQSIILNKFYNYLLNLYITKKISMYDISSRDKVIAIIRISKQQMPQLKDVCIFSLIDAVERLKKAISNKARFNELPKEKNNNIKWFSLFYSNDTTKIEIKRKHIMLHLRNGTTYNIKLKSRLRKNNRIYNYRIIKKYNIYSLIVLLDVDINVPHRQIKNPLAIDPNHKNLVVCVDSKGTTIEVENLPMVKYFFHQTDKVRSLIKKTTKNSKRYNYLSNALYRLCYKREEQIKKVLYKLAHYFTDRYDCIAMGNYSPNVKNTTNKNMRRVMINESLICKFRNILKKICEQKGVLFKDINEYGTTKKCFACGYEEHKSPDIRVYTCPKCGRTYNRDINSAINIGYKGRILSAQDYIGIDLLVPMYTIKSDYRNDDLIVILNK